MTPSLKPPAIWLDGKLVVYKFDSPDIRPILSDYKPKTFDYDSWWKNVLARVAQKHDTYELRSGAVYCWFENNQWHKIQIPPLEKHDGASVPRLMYTFSALTPDGKIRLGALIHDKLYEHGGALPRGWYQVSNAEGEWIDSPRVFTRKESDNLFLRINTEAGMSWRRYEAYAAVRVGGWTTWQTNKLAKKYL